MDYYKYVISNEINIKGEKSPVFLGPAVDNEDKHYPSINNETSSIDMLINSLEENNIKVDEATSTKTIMYEDKFNVKTPLNNNIEGKVIKYNLKANNLAIVLNDVENSGIHAHAIYFGNNKQEGTTLLNKVENIIMNVYNEGSEKQPSKIKKRRKSSNRLCEKVSMPGVRKESGYLYFLDRDGDISRSLMPRSGKKGGKEEKIKCLGIKRETGYLYFIDKDGDVARAKMARERR